MWELCFVGVVVCGIWSVWQFWCVEVAMCGSCSVRELSCGVRELWYGEWWYGELRCGGAMVWWSSGVGELQCVCVCVNGLQGTNFVPVT